eukprot:g28736.t1
MEDLQEVESQQTLFFALEASKIIFQSRVHTMEQDEMCFHFFLPEDYKILSKAIANRVRSSLGLGIHPDQTCAVLGKMISETLTLLRDMITDVQYNGVDACLINLDQTDANLRGVTVPGSGGLQIKASLSMANVDVFCSGLLSVRRCMSIYDQFELAS